MFCVGQGCDECGICSELQLCGRGVRNILLLPLVDRCLETKDVCIWSMFVFMSVVVTVWGRCAAAIVEDSGF